MRRKGAAQDFGVQSVTNVQEALKILAVVMGCAWMAYREMEPASAGSSTVVLPARTVEMETVLARTASQCVTVCTGNATARSLRAEAALAMEATPAPDVTKRSPSAEV